MHISYYLQGAINLCSLCFMVNLFLNFSAGMILPRLAASRPVYFRETGSRMYTALPYYIARYVADIPFLALECLIYGSAIYWIVGLKPQVSYLMAFALGGSSSYHPFSSFSVSYDPPVVLCVVQQHDGLLQPHTDALFFLNLSHALSCFLHSRHSRSPHACSSFFCLSTIA